MEVRLGAEGMLDEAPERLLRRSFALEVLGHAHQQLRREAVQTGRLPMFEALERYLGSEPKPGELDALSQEIGAGPLSLVVAVRRLRQRFRELVDRELCETLASPTELEAERQALWQALGGESS